jgi:hypothetical protein
MAVEDRGAVRCRPSVAPLGERDQRGLQVAALVGQQVLDGAGPGLRVLRPLPRRVGHVHPRQPAKPSPDWQGQAGPRRGRPGRDGTPRAAGRDALSRNRDAEAGPLGEPEAPLQGRAHGDSADRRSGPDRGAGRHQPASGDARSRRRHGPRRTRCGLGIAPKVALGISPPGCLDRRRGHSSGAGREPPSGCPRP